MTDRLVSLLLAVLLAASSGCAKRSGRVQAPADGPVVEAPRGPEAPRAPEGVVRTVEQVERAMGVRLHLYGPDGRPPSSLGGAEEGPVDPALVPAALPVIEDVLATYPDEVRRALVPDVWLVGLLRANGHPFLGMAHPREHRLDVAVRPRTRPAALAATLHHEIAHLLMREPGFPIDRWRAFSAGHYVGREPGKKWSGKGMPWLQYGFVSPYGSKNPAEDFATLVELGFARPDRLRALAREYPLLGKKAAFATEAYRRLAPGTELPWAGEGWTRWKADHRGADEPRT